MSGSPSMQADRERSSLDCNDLREVQSLQRPTSRRFLADREPPRCAISPRAGALADFDCVASSFRRARTGAYGPYLC
jgi:hypothetical protein